MFKRVTIVALLVLAVFLVLAIPAFAFNGYRGDYTTTDACQTCHNGIAGIPSVYKEWSETKHGEGEAYADVFSRVPTGSVCQGCHTANFDPSKPTPVPTSITTAVSTPILPAGNTWDSPTPIPTATNVAWGIATTNPMPQAPQAVGNDPWSENVIGCSSCHYGANVTGTLAQAGTDVNDTAHTAPFADMANADICGACHSRYSYTVPTYSVSPIPYVKLDGAGNPINNTAKITSIQPQMAIGYPMLGAPSPAPAKGWTPAAPLAQYLTYPQPGWTPAPTATKAGFGNLQTYWQYKGKDTLYQQTGHDGSAAQYPEWASEGHAKALTALTSMPFWASMPEATKQECLECHSADFRIMKESGKAVTSADAKYGITCVGCHAPHDAGTISGVWDEAFDAQLRNDKNLGGNGSNLCTECHNGEIPAGSTASPGAEVHHPMKEMMDGYGAIDVQSFPSVHKGKCIQCHMAPTSYSRGSAQLGGNHTFTVIEPEVAMDATPVPIATTLLSSAWEANVAGTTLTNTLKYAVTSDVMPYSACSTCHNNDVKPTPGATPSVPSSVSTSTASPSPVGAVNTILTVSQNYPRSANGAAIANPGGDRALWLQDTIDQRQEWTEAKVAQIDTELGAAAVRLGYADATAARDALVAIPEADRTASQTLFLKGWTNVQYVSSEGSYGLHNWDYSRAIVNVALAQARSVEPQAPRAWLVKLALSKSKISRGQKVFFRGAVQNGYGLAAKGKVQLQRRQAGGKWRTWKTQKLATNGSYSIVLHVNLARGRWLFRSFMPADGQQNLAGNSRNQALTIK